MWFEKAAASGVPQAMLNLGKMLENVSERHPSLARSDLEVCYASSSYLCVNGNANGGL